MKGSARQPKPELTHPPFTGQPPGVTAASNWRFMSRVSKAVRRSLWARNRVSKVSRAGNKAGVTPITEASGPPMAGSALKSNSALSKPAICTRCAPKAFKRQSWACSWPRRWARAFKSVSAWRRVAASAARSALNSVRWAAKSEALALTGARTRA